MELTDNLIEAVIGIARQAGQAIMAIYQGPLEITVKADESPLTQADKAAHHLIVQALHNLTPDWPVVSEESSAAEQALRLTSSRYWLVDPLDGTKEFIRRNGEFTVNIAMIRDGVTRFGVVHVPVSGVTYWGGEGLGAWRRDTSATLALHVRPAGAHQPLRVVGSRSHQNEETLAYLASVGPHELVAIGSSLKFCLLAEGHAQLYPRLGPTCEWDTAAAQAVLEGAGGRVETLDGEPLRYSKPAILNPWFVARV